MPPEPNMLFEDRRQSLVNGKEIPPGSLSPHDFRWLQFCELLMKGFLSGARQIPQAGL